MRRILVVDGMGGGMGKTLIAELKNRIPDAEITACGTNGLATQAMLKAGAKVGVTGENAIIYQASRADVICGSFGILIPHAMQGEMSPAMAEALAASDAPKFLLPVHKCQIYLASPDVSLADSIELLLERLEQFLTDGRVDE